MSFLVKPVQTIACGELDVLHPPCQEDRWIQMDPLIHRWIQMDSLIHKWIHCRQEI